MSGRLLVQLDPKGLLLLGVTNESDQWRILQARHDILTLEVKEEKKKRGVEKKCERRA